MRYHDTSTGRHARPPSFMLLASALAWAALLFALPQPAAAQSALTLSVYPYLAASELVDRFTPFAQYLGQQIGRRVDLEIGTSYHSHIDRIGGGGVDLAFMGPASYVKFTAKYGKRPILAAYSTKEGKFYHGHIMVREDSPIVSLGQLTGKRFVFGDVNSTMSHHVPRYLLLKAGIDVKQFAKVTFLPNQENIVLGVLAGTFDAGAVKEEIFKQYAARGLRSLARSAPITDHLFIASDRLAPETVQALTKACLALSTSDQGRQILTSLRSDVTALVPGDDSDFDALRAIAQELKAAGVDL